MKIRLVSYSFSDKNESYPEVQFSGTNLLVGSTGSGKSRFIESIFRLGKFVASNADATEGKWACRIDVDGDLFDYKLEVVRALPKPIVVHEQLSHLIGGEATELLLREQDKVTFKGATLPNLDNSTTLVHLMSGEPAVAPVFSFFRRIRRRNFSGTDNEKSRILQLVPPALLAQLQRDKPKDLTALAELALSGALFILKRCYPSVFESIVRDFKDVFPHVTSLDEMKPSDLDDFPNAPDVAIMGLREKWTTKPIALPFVSAGMLKALLIITDLHTLTEGSIYLIDEYENSLGVNAIDFFPDLMVKAQSHVQFFITSHHPYLINQIPLKNWYVFARQGREVHIKFGNEIAERYGLSKQEAFVQLINDPFYIEGTS